MKIRIIEGDATQLPSDALVTLANSKGDWYGMIDRAIQKQTGNSFHDRLRGILQSGQGDAIYIPALDVDTPYRAVLFVIDDIVEPLEKVIDKAIGAMASLKLREVTLPAFRCGAALSVTKLTIDETAKAIARGMYVAMLRHKLDNDVILTFVIHSDPVLAQTLRRALQPIFPNALEATTK